MDTSEARNFINELDGKLRPQREKQTLTKIEGDSDEGFGLPEAEQQHRHFMKATLDDLLQRRSLNVFLRRRAGRTSKKPGSSISSPDENAGVVGSWSCLHPVARKAKSLSLALQLPYDRLSSDYANRKVPSQKVEHRVLMSRCEAQELDRGYTQVERQIRLGIASDTNNVLRSLKIIQFGADVDGESCDDYGRCALEIAIIRGHWNVARFLVEESGAEISDKVKIAMRVRVGTFLEKRMFEEIGAREPNFPDKRDHENMCWLLNTMQISW